MYTLYKVNSDELNDNFIAAIKERTTTSND
jgi:hypothetical protein